MFLPLALLLVQFLTPAASATDIHATDILYSGPSGFTTDLHCGEPVTFCGAFDLATAAPVAIGMSLKVDGDVVAKATTDPLGTGSWYWCAGYWNPTEGPHTIQVVLDTNNTIPESDETNNTVTHLKTATAIVPDLGAVDFTFVDTSWAPVALPLAGQDVAACATYSVVACGEANVVAKLEIDGHVQTLINAGPTGYGWWGYCQTPFWRASAGIHHLRLTVDPDNAIAESDEANNVLERTITVAGPTPQIVADPLEIAVTCPAPGAASPVLAALDEANLRGVLEVADGFTAPCPTKGGMAVMTFEQFDVFTPGARVLAGGTAGVRMLPVPRCRFFRGRAGDGARAVLTLDPCGALSLATLDGKGGMEFLRSGTDGALHRDAAPPSPGIHCASEGLVQPALPTAIANAVADSADALPPLLAAGRLDIDYRLYSGRFGGSVEAAAGYAAQVTALASLIYERDLAVRLALSEVMVWTSPDPFVAPPGDTITALNTFQAYYQAHPPSPSLAFHHLFAGDGCCYGAAYYGLCDPANRYGVENMDGPAGQDTALLFAHEIGHCFFSPHTHCYSPPIDCCWNREPGCNCGTESSGVDGTIMSYCSQTGGRIQPYFHPRCSALMRGIAESRACITSDRPLQRLHFTLRNQGGGPLEIVEIVPEVAVSWLQMPLSGPIAIAPGGSMEFTAFADCDLLPAGGGSVRLLVHSSDGANTPLAGGVTVTGTRAGGGVVWEIR